MLIELPVGRCGEVLRQQTFVMSAPWTFRKCGSCDAAIVEAGDSCWHVNLTVAEVREKWEKALACDCPTYKGHKMHWDGCDKVGPNVFCACSVAHNGPCKPLGAKGETVRPFLQGMTATEAAAHVGLCKPPPCSGWSQVWASDL